MVNSVANRTPLTVVSVEATGVTVHGPLTGPVRASAH
jgi:hypothetical protein